MKLAYPLHPQNPGYPPFITQAFGVNPAYYAKFGTKGHMGVDFMAPHGTPVYAAHDGFAFYVGPDAHGGDGVYIRFQDEELKWWTIINWHLIAKTDRIYAPLVDSKGRQVKQGDLIGFADNTGAPFESTGDHLHFGLAPCDKDGTFVELGNGYGGCVDPKPYFTIQLSASDQVAVLAAQKQAQGNTYQSGVLFALAKFLKSFFV